MDVAIKGIRLLFGEDSCIVRMNAKSGAYKDKINDIVGETITVKSAYAIDIERVNSETGEVEKYVKNIWVCEEGVFTSSSPSFENDMLMFFEEMEPGQQVTVSVQSVSSRNHEGKYLKALVQDIIPGPAYNQ